MIVSATSVQKYNVERGKWINSYDSSRDLRNAPKLRGASKAMRGRTQ